ncbi:MAG: DUF2188 domain-containing protein [Chloroflexi bacterium]|nr:DUF2188 domain-containing protein [Chloroflexota bacterium]
MRWTTDNYPTEFEKFEPHIRNKMIEIANRLVAEEDYEEITAVPAAITLAKEWAGEQGIEVKVLYE